MTQLETPKNLTRNVLIGMFAGVLFASLFYYSQEFTSQQIFLFVEKYVFNLGGQIFKNLLLLIVVPLVFFSLVSGISSLSKYGKARIYRNKNHRTLSLDYSFCSHNRYLFWMGI